MIAIQAGHRAGALRLLALSFLCACGGRASIDELGTGGDAARPAGGRADVTAAAGSAARGGESQGGAASFAGSPQGQSGNAGANGGGSAGAAGNAGAAGSIDQTPPRALLQVVSQAPWYVTQFVTGVAVDSNDDVYVNDEQGIYQVHDGAVSTYLTVSEAAAAIGVTQSQGFADLDMGPDGALYFLAAGALLRSANSHQATLWSQATGRFLSVVDQTRIGVLDDTGLFIATQQGNTPLYTSQQLQRNLGDCADEDLSIAPSGVLLYEPGCLDYPLLRGHTDDSGLMTLYTSNLMGSGSAIAASNFLCTARDPAGGFYVMTEDDSGMVAERLFHVADDADGASGLREIPTQPTFADAGAHSGNSFVFHFCSMAAAKDGAIFIQSYSQLWKVEP